jgi:hypothetical protein
MTAPGFLLRHEHARPRHEEQPMPFQEGKSGNPARRPRGSRNRQRARVQSLLEGGGCCALEAKAFDERLAKVESLAANNAKRPHFGNGI